MDLYNNICSLKNPKADVEFGFNEFLKKELNTDNFKL